MNNLITSRPRPVAIIARNRYGNWSLIIPEAGVPIGNYGTAPDASAVALLNGYEPEIHDVPPVVDATNPKIWKPEAVRA